jgi:hypothetical protein
MDVSKKCSALTFSVKQAKNSGLFSPKDRDNKLFHSVGNYVLVYTA